LTLGQDQYLGREIRDAGAAGEETEEHERVVIQIGRSGARLGPTGAAGDIGAQHELRSRTFERCWRMRWEQKRSVLPNARALVSRCLAFRRWMSLYLIDPPRIAADALRGRARTPSYRTERAVGGNVEQNRLTPNESRGWRCRALRLASCGCAETRRRASTRDRYNRSADR
jgi:hypothetical protein